MNELGLKARPLRATVLNLQINIPFGGIERLGHRGPPRLLENADIYITIHQGRKIADMKQQ